MLCGGLWWYQGDWVVCLQGHLRRVQISSIGQLALGINPLLMRQADSVNGFKPWCALRNFFAWKLRLLYFWGQICVAPTSIGRVLSDGFLLFIVTIDRDGLLHGNPGWSASVVAGLLTCTTPRVWIIQIAGQIWLIWKGKSHPRAALTRQLVKDLLTMDNQGCSFASQIIWLFQGYFGDFVREVEHGVVFVELVRRLLHGTHPGRFYLPLLHDEGWRGFLSGGPGDGDRAYIRARSNDLILLLKKLHL